MKLANIDFKGRDTLLYNLTSLHIVDKVSHRYLYNKFSTIALSPDYNIWDNTTQSFF